MTADTTPQQVIRLAKRLRNAARIAGANADHFASVRADDARAAARLLAPQRPEGVPDNAVAVTLWFSPADENGITTIYYPKGSGRRSSEGLLDLGVPVPPYRPAPDPEALLVEKITADWTHPDPADSPTGLVATPLTYTPPVAGERTGPLGLSEAETRYWAQRERAYAGPWADGCRALQRACRECVVEWDADTATPQPEPTDEDFATPPDIGGAR